MNKHFVMLPCFPIAVLCLLSLDNHSSLVVSRPAFGTLLVMFGIYLMKYAQNGASSSIGLILLASAAPTNASTEQRHKE